ncbi:hypothetical protein NUH86_01605 [Sphingobium sp. JS3065]|uniref:hypothetical protein n=1 Tax=Sphingobium sp. JS3065 TaxID=2970925 RepID=UPI0022654A9D|nr:hypothetical protein [Sphingobium sp. JS3065]UZW55526.1 hypothetical protein NUH86_01605 [Sphingobium sp. JS3065]
MTLQDYLVREGLSYTAFAALIGARFPSTAERYAKGLVIPGRAMMTRIFWVTNREVTPNDFYGLHPLEDKVEAATASSHSDAADMSGADLGAAA